MRGPSTFRGRISLWAIFWIARWRSPTPERRASGSSSRLEAPEGRLWGDASLLRQVFDNCRQRRASDGDRGAVDGARARATKRRDGLAVDIIDTGEGMDTQVRSRALDPFFTTRPSGTGLGLAIVDRIVDAHGGHFAIHSRVGEGTTVTVFLPHGSPSEPPPPRSSRKARSDPPQRPAGPRDWRRPPHGPSRHRSSRQALRVAPLHADGRLGARGPHRRPQRPRRPARGRGRPPLPRRQLVVVGRGARPRTPSNPAGPSRAGRDARPLRAGRDRARAGGQAGRRARRHRAGRAHARLLRGRRLEAVDAAINCRRSRALRQRWWRGPRG